LTLKCLFVNLLLIHTWSPGVNPKELFRPAWRWTVLAIVLSACVLAIFIVRGGRTPQKQIAEIGSARPAGIPARPQGANAGASPQPTPAQAVSTAVKDELCGVSGPDLLRAGNETIEQHVARLTQHAISQWQGSLSSSGDPRRQAIALALTNADPRGEVVDPEELASGSEPSKDTPANNNLVLLATETSDPAIYSLAIGQCRNIVSGDMASGPCQALSWEHWASIDPDNGMPWLWIAARAEGAGDQPGVETALAKAATASRFDSYASELSAVALGAVPGGSAPLEKAVAGGDVISMLRVGTPVGLVSMCSQSAIQQPLRKQQCSAIATTLAKEGSTYFDLAMASSLANRLGFPEETRAALVAERKQARLGLTISHPWNTDDGSRYRCASLLAYDGFIDALRAARGNERAALAGVSRTVQGGK
jgi:hypothetical protein